jgi:hypothetical protein
MALIRLPELFCTRCGAAHNVTLHDDGSIRSASHSGCTKPVPGPPTPPQIYDKGKFWIVPTTCIECGAKGQAVTQMQGMVHKTILCGTL